MSCDGQRAELCVLADARKGVGLADRSVDFIDDGSVKEPSLSTAYSCERTLLYRNTHTVHCLV